MELKLINKVTIEGKLVKIKDNFATSKKSGKEYGQLELTVRTADNEQHIVKMMAMKLKKDGTVNSQYTGLETVANEYKSVETHGEDLADLVSVVGGLNKNHYVSKTTGEVQSINVIDGRFCNRVEADKYAPHTEFTLNAYVKSTATINNAEGDFDHLKVVLVVPFYGEDMVEEFEMQLRNEQGADYVMDTYAPGTAGSFAGVLVNKVETETMVKSNGGWGKEITETKTKRTQRLEILGCSEPMENEDTSHPLSKEVVSKGLAKLATRKTELLSQQPSTTTAPQAGSFGGTKPTVDVTQNIPF